MSTSLSVNGITQYRRYYGGCGAYAADPSHPYGYYHDYGDPRCGVPNYTI